MTQEDKDLVLRDLSARLPYHPFAYGKSGYVYNEGRLILVTSSGCAIMTGGGSHVHYFFNEIKLYLRPMSSMAEEEFIKLKEYTGLIYDQLDLALFQNGTYKCLDFYLNEIPSDVVILVFDWLNKYHFDYRGLIEKGFALEAPEGMYK